MTRLSDLARLTDPQLTDGLVASHAAERGAIADVVARLVEVERRKLFAREGSSSMFAYCTDKLGMSHDVAGTRIGAVRIAKSYPIVLEMLADGRLYLSGVRTLRPHLTPDNHAGLFAAAAGQRRRGHAADGGGSQAVADGS